MNDLKKGQTGINEHARRILDISRDEYAFCSYVLYRQADAKQLRRGFCCDPKQEVAEFVGVSRQGLYKMIDRMQTANLMEVQPNGDLATMPRFTQIESNGKESLQSKINGTVNLVDSKCKLSLQPSVNLVTGNKEVLDRNKIEEKEYNVGEKNADGEIFLIKTFEEVKLPSLEAKKEREEKPSPTVPGEIPKRDPNDPRANLEFRMEKIKDLAGNYQEGNPSLERMRVNYRVMKAEYNLEGNIDIVVARLNEKAKMPRGYKADKKETRTAIRKRLKEYSLEDLFTVVDFKCREWKDDPKLRQYLRPDTLFNGHFEDYLNAALQDKQNPIAEKKPYAPPAYRHEAPPASTAQAGYVE